MKTKYILAVVIFALIIGLMSFFGCRPNPVERPPFIATPVPTPCDGFEDGEFTTASSGSQWESSASPSSSRSTTVLTQTGNDGTYSLRYSADNIGDGWAWTACGMWLDTGGATIEVDLTAKRDLSYSGFRMKTRGTTGPGTPVVNYIQLISTDSQGDSSHWRYTWTPNESDEWVTLEIEWSDFSSPGWGATAAYSLDQILQTAKMLNFSLSSNVQDGASNIGSTWDIDSLEYY